MRYQKELNYGKMNAILYVCIAVSLLFLRFYYLTPVQYSYVVYSIFIGSGAYILLLMFGVFESTINNIETAMEHALFSKSRPGRSVYFSAGAIFAMSAVSHGLMAKVVNNAALRIDVFVVAWAGVALMAGVIWAIERYTKTQLEDARTYKSLKKTIVSAFGVCLALFLNALLVIFTLI